MQSHANKLREALRQTGLFPFAGSMDARGGAARSPIGLDRT
jgi:hypothetical protein